MGSWGYVSNNAFVGTNITEKAPVSRRTHVRANNGFYNTSLAST